MSVGMAGGKVCWEPLLATVAERRGCSWRSTTPRGRIGLCSCGRRARHRRFPSRSTAGSGVDRSWAGSSTSTKRQHETADQAPRRRSGTRQAPERVGGSGLKPLVSAPARCCARTTCTTRAWWKRQSYPVGFQNVAVVPDQRFQAAASYSLRSPPRTGRRQILSSTGSGIDDVGRGGRNRSARCGRAVL